MNKKFCIKIFSLLAVALVISSFQAKAQDDGNSHFIYIQAKNKKPFYVILNDKVLSSSNIGYLIIPKLKSGAYNLHIGFPRQANSEQAFTCVVKDADMGYSLQRNDNGDLGLLDLQSQNFITSSAAMDNSSATKTTSKKDRATDNNVVPSSTTSSSAFGNMLSSAANDSTLSQPIVKKEEQATTSVLQTTIASTQNTDNSSNVINNNVADANQSSTQQPVTTPTVTNNAATDNLQTYGVIKSGENTVSDGKQMTFILFNNRSTDTVQIVIPAVSPTAPTSSDDGTSATNSNTSNNDGGNLSLFGGTDDAGSNTATSSSTKNRSRKKHKTSDDEASNTQSNTDTTNTVNNPYYNNSSSNNSSSTDDNNSAATSSANTATAVPCDNPISDKDFTKLQKKMIDKSNDDDMLALADKAIKGKCISTEQVKKIGALFLSDAGRFALYQDAYPDVYDKENYSSLQNQLLDSYFKTRFSDMLSKPSN